MHILKVWGIGERSGKESNFFQFLAIIATNGLTKPREGRILGK